MLPDRKSTLSIAANSIDFERARAVLAAGYSKQCSGEGVCPTNKIVLVPSVGAATPTIPPPSGTLGQCGAFVSDADLERAEKTGTPPITDSKRPASPSDIRWLDYFEISWYDFPLTDYTVRHDKTRCAIVIDRVCPVEKVIRLELVWFPKDFSSAYERPITHSELMSRLGLK